MKELSGYEWQLTQPQWYYVRNRVLERDGYRCMLCRSSSHLEVHHKYYLKGHKAWEYNDEALETLCDRCHAAVHGKLRPMTRLEIALDRLVVVASGVRDWCYKQYPEDGEEIH